MSIEQVIRAYGSALNANGVQTILDGTDQMKVMSAEAQKCSRDD